ncbi:hypothetical protein TNCV_3558391 [Trichonephila clavipes]|uniref:Uncharacterized protein n=1 Tax=Trichonephila clavipes TaxID=2585209 RepID=A0A8X6WDQ5_TRICX|nr:hypothetical protein TNCV_3558391 [Trichonephila clavipes]
MLSYVIMASKYVPYLLQVRTWHSGTTSIVSLRHEDTTLRSAKTILRLVERAESLKAPNHPQGALPQNFGGSETNHPVTCIMLKAEGNYMRKKLALRHDEFREPPSDIV